MTWKNTAARWGSLSIALHWLMLILMVGVYACIELKGFFPKGSETRELLKQWHFMLGLSVFALVWLRLLARAIVVIDAKGTVLHTQLVPEIAEEPNYEAALAALK